MPAIVARIVRRLASMAGPWTPVAFECGLCTPDAVEVAGPCPGMCGEGGGEAHDVKLASTARIA